MDPRGFGAGRRALGTNRSALLLQLARRPPVRHPDSGAGASSRRKRDPLRWSVRSAAAQPGDLGSRFCSPGLRLRNFLHDGHRKAHGSVVAGLGAPPASAGNTWAWRGGGGQRSPRAPPARRRPAPRPPQGGATGRPFIGLQVAGDAEAQGSQPAGLAAALRPAVGTGLGRGERAGGGRRGASGGGGRARRGRGRAGPRGRSRSTPGESGRILRWILRWNGAHPREWAGRPAGLGERRWRGGGEAGGSLLPLRGNLGRLRGHKGRDYLGPDDVRASHLGDA